MSARSISFEPDALSFLLLNIVGHDPIHDFGEPSDTRWYQVSQQIDKIKPFLLAYDSYSDNEVVSGRKRRIVDDDNEDETKTRKRNKVGGFLLGNNLINARDNLMKTHKNTNFKRDSLQNKGNVVVVERDSTSDDSKTVLLEYIEHVKCKIVMNIFLNHMNEKKTNSSESNFMSLYEMCYKVCVNSRNDSDYEVTQKLCIHLHDYIIERFLLNINENEKGVLVVDAAMTFSKLIIRYSFVDLIPGMNEMSNTTILNSIKSNVVNVDIHPFLKKFLNSNHYFYNSIGKTIGSTSAVYGGENSNVVDNIDKNYDISSIRQTLSFIDAVFTCVDVPDTFTNVIDDLRKSMYYYTIASKGYGIPVESHISLDDLNGVITQKKNLEPVNLDEINKTLLFNRERIMYLYRKAFQQLNVEKSKIDGIISKLENIIIPQYKNTRTTISLKIIIQDVLSNAFRSEKQIKKKYDEKIRKDKIIDDKKMMALSSGNLTPLNKETAHRFIGFIAKSALYLTRCCDKNGNIIKDMKNDKSGRILQVEVQAIRTVGGRYNERNNSYWGPTEGSMDIDTKLFDFLRESTTDYGLITEKPFNMKHFEQGQRGLYVINNAANISPSFKNKSFCPYTSILDGMSQCSWASASSNKNRLERGNMDFIIGSNNTSDHYRGTLEISTEDTVEVKIDVKLGNFNLIQSKKINMNSDDLVAHVVLRKTLGSIIEFMDKNEYLYVERDVFRSLFDIGVLDVSQPNTHSPGSPSHPNSIFNLVFKELLFKGVGDIFQEINAVSKFGGYTSDNYYSGSLIKSFFGSANGNVPRCFVAKDRVSICRFIFMKQVGNKSEINTMAFGGYVDGASGKSNMGIKLLVEPQNRIRGGTRLDSLQSLDNRTQNIVTKKYTLKKMKNKSDITLNISIDKTMKNKNLTINLKFDDDT